MSAAADLVARLAREGIDPQLLAEVAQELFALQTERDILAKRKETERENSRRYRARLGKEIPGWLRRDVFERDNYRCVDCGTDERLECDHIIPLTAGGTSDFDNLQTLCKSCNSRKRDRIRKADKRGQPRTKADREDERGSAPATPNERDILTPTRVEKPSPKGEVKKWPAPEGVSGQTWSDFLLSPKRRKAGMSATAYAGIVNNLAILAEHGFPPGEMIALAVERGWTTVKLEWVLNDQRTVRNERNNSPSPLDQLVAASLGYGHGVGESP